MYHTYQPVQYKSRTKSLKKQDFFVKKQDVLNNLMKIAEIIKLRSKILHKNTLKKVGHSKEKWDSRKFSTKIRIVPLKTGQLESMVYRCMSVTCVHIVYEYESV